MSNHKTSSKTTQVFDAKPGQKNQQPKQVASESQIQKDSDPRRVATALLTHEDISEQAYKTYVKNDCRQGESEQNWLKAEQELYSRLK